MLKSLAGFCIRLLFAVTSKNRKVSWSTELSNLDYDHISNKYSNLI